MTTYILILIILFPSSETAGVINSIEFSSYATCETAAAGYKERGFDRDTHYNSGYKTEISAKCWAK
jgi:hypothetical protein